MMVFLIGLKFFTARQTEAGIAKCSLIVKKCKVNHKQPKTLISRNYFQKSFYLNDIRTIVYEVSLSMIGFVTL